MAVFNVSRSLESVSKFLALSQTALLLVRSLPVYALQRALFQSQAASHLLWVFVVKGTSNKYRKRDRQDSNSCMDFLNGFLPLGFKSARARDWARTEC